jgi:hypothetical protein
MRLRNHQSDAVSEPRRQGRGWGPFSGGQLTAIVITLAIVIGFPVAAFAVTGSNSFITDFTSGAHAKVDAKKNVNTAIHDATSGVAAKVDSLGRQLALVAGSVTVNGVTRPAKPVDLFTTTRDIVSCTTIEPPAGTALVVTSIGITNYSTGTDIMVNRQVGDCVSYSGSYLKARRFIGNLGYAEISFPSGLVIPDGGAIKIYGATTSSTVNGYLVPSSACPTSAACLKGD